MSLPNFLVAVFQSITLCLICGGFSVAYERNLDLNGDRSLFRTRREVETTSYFYYQQADYPRDCQEVRNQCGNTTDTDGVYLIKPDGYPEPFEVFCNNTIDGGSWTVFQRRKFGEVDFDRSWADYKNGFGFIHRDFWLGNDKLASLTNQKNYELRIDFESRVGQGASLYAYYTLFRISDEGTKYKLVGLGTYSGNIGAGSMDSSSGAQFSTYDQDNDASSSYHCATKHQGGWWYVTHNCFSDNACDRWSSGGSYCKCSTANLNGKFGGTGATGIYWSGFACTFSYTEMKIRPVQSD